MTPIRNLPIPPAGRAPRVPLRDLEPGEALYVPFSRATRRQLTHAASDLAYRYPGYRFAVRKARDGRRGCYVWRVRLPEASA